MSRNQVGIQHQPQLQPIGKQEARSHPSTHTHKSHACRGQALCFPSTCKLAGLQFPNRPPSSHTHTHPKSRHCPAILVQEWALSSVWLSWGKQLLTADSGEQNPQLICLKQGSLRSHLCDSLTRPSLGKLGEKRKEERENPTSQETRDRGSKLTTFPSLKPSMATPGNTSTHHCWQVAWALALGKESSTQRRQTLYTDSYL